MKKFLYVIFSILLLFPLTAYCSSKNWSISLDVNSLTTDNSIFLVNDGIILFQFGAYNGSIPGKIIKYSFDGEQQWELDNKYGTHAFSVGDGIIAISLEGDGKTIKLTKISGNNGSTKNYDLTYDHKGYRPSVSKGVEAYILDNGNFAFYLGGLKICDKNLTKCESKVITTNDEEVKKYNISIVSSNQNNFIVMGHQSDERKNIYDNSKNNYTTFLIGTADENLNISDYKIINVNNDQLKQLFSNKINLEVNSDDFSSLYNSYFSNPLHFLYKDGYILSPAPNKLGDIYPYIYYFTDNNIKEIPIDGMLIDMQIIDNEIFTYEYSKVGDYYAFEIIQRDINFNKVKILETDYVAPVGELQSTSNIVSYFKDRFLSYRNSNCTSIVSLNANLINAGSSYGIPYTRNILSGQNSKINHYSLCSVNSNLEQDSPIEEPPIAEDPPEELPIVENPNTNTGSIIVSAIMLSMTVIIFSILAFNKKNINKYK